MFMLRKSQPGEPLVVAMTAARLGDRLLVIGCSDPKIVAQLAVKPGLTGRACAVDESAEFTGKAAAAAEKAGALLETETAPFHQLPFEGGSFDVVAVSRALAPLPVDRRRQCLSEASRVLREGGRCIVIESGQAAGIAGLFRKPGITPDGIAELMGGAGFRAVHTLADRQGLAFVEGARR